MDSKSLQGVQCTEIKNGLIKYSLHFVCICRIRFQLTCVCVYFSVFCDWNYTGNGVATAAATTTEEINTKIAKNSWIANAKRLLSRNVKWSKISWAHTQSCQQFGLELNTYTILSRCCCCWWCWWCLVSVCETAVVWHRLIARKSIGDRNYLFTVRLYTKSSHIHFYYCLHWSRSPVTVSRSSFVSFDFLFFPSHSLYSNLSVHRLPIIQNDPIFSSIDCLFYTCDASQLLYSLQFFSPLTCLLFR